MGAQRFEQAQAEARGKKRQRSPLTRTDKEFTPAQIDEPLFFSRNAQAMPLCFLVQKEKSNTRAMTGQQRAAGAHLW